MRLGGSWCARVLIRRNIAGVKLAVRSVGSRVRGNDGGGGERWYSPPVSVMDGFETRPDVESYS